jgi:SRSO17 transposase
MSQPSYAGYKLLCHSCILPNKNRMLVQLAMNIHLNSISLSVRISVVTSKFATTSIVKILKKLKIAVL